MDYAQLVDELLWDDEKAMVWAMSKRLTLIDSACAADLRRDALAERIAAVAGMDVVEALPWRMLRRDSGRLMSTP